MAVVSLASLTRNATLNSNKLVDRISEVYIMAKYRYTRKDEKGNMILIRRHYATWSQTGESAMPRA